MVSQTGTMLQKEHKPDVIEILDFLNKMPLVEQEKILAFVQGMKFKEDLERQRKARAAG